MVTVRGGETQLYTWRGDAWDFLAEPTSGVCREQLEELGVPDKFRRVFQPCDVTTSPTTTSPTTDESTTSQSPDPTTTEPSTTTSGEDEPETTTENGAAGAGE